MSEFIANSPQRLDTFLASQASISRTSAKRLIQAGNVRVGDGIVTKPSYILHEGQNVGFSLVERKASPGIESEDLKLEILYEDSSCIVINKPAGISVHPASSMGKDEKTLLNGIAFLFRERGIPFSNDAVLVHRLDKETTGCLLIAKTPQAHAKLQKQFEKRTVEKIYLALVAGVPSPPSAKIDAPIGRNLVNRTLMSIFKTSKSREAKTSYKTLDTKDDVSLLQCKLHTGRTHQIRVHLRSIGHPVLGDTTYKTNESEERTRKYGIKGLCLHAWKLVFASPENGERVEVEAPLGDPLNDFLVRIGFSR